MVWFRVISFFFLGGAIGAAAVAALGADYNVRTRGLDFRRFARARGGISERQVSARVSNCVSVSAHKVASNFLVSSLARSCSSSSLMHDERRTCCHCAVSLTAAAAAIEPSVLHRVRRLATRRPTPPQFGRIVRGRRFVCCRCCCLGFDLSCRGHCRFFCAFSVVGVGVERRPRRTDDLPARSPGAPHT